MENEFTSDLETYAPEEVTFLNKLEKAQKQESEKKDAMRNKYRTLSAIYSDQSTKPKMIRTFAGGALK